MFNAFALIPMFRTFLWLPLLWIARYRGDRKAIIWYSRRLQYEDCCMQWWEGGGPSFNWKEFQKPQKRREIQHFYKVEVPKIMAERFG